MSCPYVLSVDAVSVDAVSVGVGSAGVVVSVDVGVGVVSDEGALVEVCSP